MGNCRSIQTIQSVSHPQNPEKIMKGRVFPVITEDANDRTNETEKIEVSSKPRRLKRPLVF